MAKCEQTNVISLIDREAAAHKAAQTLSEELVVCKKSSAEVTEKVGRCRDMLKRLSVAFNGLQCGANDKISVPIQRAIENYLFTLVDDEGEPLDVESE